MVPGPGHLEAAQNTEASTLTRAPPPCPPPTAGRCAVVVGGGGVRVGGGGGVVGGVSGPSRAGHIGRVQKLDPRALRLLSVAPATQGSGGAKQARLEVVFVRNAAIQRSIFGTFGGAPGRSCHAVGPVSSAAAAKRLPRTGVGRRGACFECAARDTFCVRGYLAFAVSWGSRDHPGPDVVRVKPPMRPSGDAASPCAASLGLPWAPGPRARSFLCATGVVAGAPSAAHAGADTPGHRGPVCVPEGSRRRPTQAGYPAWDNTWYQLAPQHVTHVVHKCQRIPEVLWGKTTRSECRRTHRRRTRTGARSTTPTAISRLCAAVRRKSSCQSDVTDWRRGNQPGTRRHGAPQTREPRCNRTQALGLSRCHGPVTLTQASSGNQACTDNWAREHGVTLHAAPRTHAPQRIRNQALARTVVKFVVHL